MEQSDEYLQKTKDINLACMLQGSFPQKADEIAIDRMHADNVGIKVGDTVTVSGETYKVVGLLAYVNYSTLHEKTTDLMFDALKFDVSNGNTQEQSTGCFGILGILIFIHSLSVCLFCKLSRKEKVSCIAVRRFNKLAFFAE